MREVSVKLRIKMYIYILQRLMDAVRRNAPESRERAAGILNFFPSRQCSSTPVGCVQGFLNKEYCDNTGAFPIHAWHGSSRFLPLPSTETSNEVEVLVWYYWHNLECDVRAEKDFIKWLPWMFSTHIQSLAEVYSYTRKLFWNLNSLLFCINKMIPETFWSYHIFITTNTQQ
jgi:hypothetical protein